MPAASRKRNKGKDRKAKQIAKKEENERVDANRYWRSWCASNQWCDHGCAMTSNSHPVTSFMDQLTSIYIPKECQYKEVYTIYLKHIDRYGPMKITES